MLISKNFIRHYVAIVSLAFASACAVVSCVPDSAHAQIVNPAQPATGVPIAGTGITVSGQTVSINYGLGSQTYTGNFNIGGTLTAGSFAPTSISTGALTANGTVSGAGFSNLFAAAYPIGSTTPNTGAFTTLAASGTVSGAGFSNLFAAAYPIGSTTPNTGAFTTLSASTATVSGVINQTATTTASTSTALSAVTTAQTVDTFPVATFRSAKYVIQVTQGTAYQVAEILVLTDGTNTYLQTYATASSTGSQFATYSTTVTGGNLVLSVTFNTATAGSAKLSVIRTLI